jgi:hypothetical protein
MEEMRKIELIKKMTEEKTKMKMIRMNNTNAIKNGVELGEIINCYNKK